MSSIFLGGAVGILLYLWMRRRESRAYDRGIEDTLMFLAHLGEPVPPSPEVEAEERRRG